MILPRHRSVVLWGLAEPTGDSFQHIWRHFAHALDRLDKPYVWLPDAPEWREQIRPGDLVFAVDVAAQHLGPPVDGADYLLHNILDTHPVRDGLDPDRCVYLQVWTNDCAERGESWGSVRRWDRHSHVLYQPWGTDLLPDEFYPPVFNADSGVAAFVGSVWEGNGQGNEKAIRELRRVLAEHGLEFTGWSGVDDKAHVELIRSCRIAPAIAGQWQCENGYLPCRVFKNVSYGALAITNVSGFGYLMPRHSASSSIDELVDDALRLNSKEYVDLVAAQQNGIKDFTYRESLLAIERAFEEIR